MHTDISMLLEWDYAPSSVLL